MCFTLFSEI
uniref:BLTX399 n=1 Tax=Nephila pilipes TaxID=299642 RepID=A0A076KUV1_NEPPI|nr:BLTX399 [Nephila pilipes]